MGMPNMLKPEADSELIHILDADMGQFYVAAVAAVNAAAYQPYGLVFNACGCFGIARHGAVIRVAAGVSRKSVFERVINLKTGRNILGAGMTDYNNKATEKY
jgi:hypothetical protein